MQTFLTVRLEDFFEQLIKIMQNFNKFLTLDLSSGMANVAWRIALNEETKHKTAFITHDSLYQLKHMPFGLVNAPTIFQMVMNMVLSGFTWKHCLVYIYHCLVR